MNNKHVMMIVVTLITILVMAYLVLNLAKPCNGNYKFSLKEFEFTCTQQPGKESKQTSLFNAMPPDLPAAVAPPNPPKNPGEALPIPVSTKGSDVVLAKQNEPPITPVYSKSRLGLSAEEDKILVAIAHTRGYTGQLGQMAETSGLPGTAQMSELRVRSVLGKLEEKHLIFSVGSQVSLMPSTLDYLVDSGLVN
jgi:hypothetical protein